MSAPGGARAIWSRRLTRYVDLGLIDAEFAIADPAAAERDAQMLAELEAEDADDPDGG